MRRRVVIGLIVAALAAALVVWIARNTYWAEQAVPVPPRGEAARNPLYGARRLAEELGVRTLTRDAPLALPRDGVLIVSRWHWQLLPSHRARIERWVEKGGRLVVDETLLEATPSFSDWSRIRRERLEPRRAAGERDGESAADDAAPEDLLAGFQPCRKLTASAGDPPRGTRAYSICGLHAATRLVSDEPVEWSLGDETAVHVIVRRIGRGRLAVVNGRSFDNPLLLRGDDAVLLAQLALWRAGDTSVFLRASEADSLLTLAWRHGAAAVLLALLAIAALIWRALPRFGPALAPPAVARRSLAEQIRGSSRFIARHTRGQPLLAAMRRAVDEEARRRVPGWRGLGDASSLEALAHALKLDVAALRRELHDAPADTRGGALTGPLASLEILRRRIAALDLGKER